MNKNVVLLTMAGALGMCVAPMVVFVGGIVGATLAPSPEWSTLPIAAQIVGTALGVVPAVHLMRELGRKAVFIASALISCCAALCAAFSVLAASFPGFTGSIAVLGMGLAVVQQYRFAAMESVAVPLMPQAASRVLLGGLVAAFLGPELAYQGRYLISEDFAGAFILLAIICFLGALVLCFYHSASLLTETHNAPVRRTNQEILRQPLLWVSVLSASVAYALMSFIMTATPVSMHHLHGYSLLETKWVIQAHIFAMFLPSFVSGRLIKRFGEIPMMWSGIIVYIICIGVALSGHGIWQFWLALILLGIGWNFLFIAGTALLPHSYRGTERFFVQGLNDFLVFGLQAVAALSSGVVIYSLGWSPLVLLSLPFLGVPIAALLYWQRTAGKTPSAI